MKLMKSFLALYLLFALGSISVSWAAQEDFTKTKIAILDFSLQGDGLDVDMGKIVAEWMITALVKDGRFDVVERRLLESIIDEHKLVMTGVVDANSAEELGHLLGVKVIITGSLMKYQNVMEANARIIDVKNASIVAAESVKSSSAIKLEDLVKEMTEKIISDFPLEGYVVSCKDEIVMLDLGFQSGVKPGMQFSVYKEGEVIKHPRTGEVLDIERVPIAIVEIESVRKKLSNARIISHNEGMIVEYGQHVSSLRPHLPVSSSFSAPVVQNMPPAQNIQSSPPAPVVQAPSPVAAPVVTSNEIVTNPLYKRIRSDNSRTKIRAIKEVAKMRYIDDTTLDLLESELLKGYLRQNIDKYFVDALSWCCTILGKTGNPRYEKTLSTVLMGTSHKKLKGYAQNGLALIEKKRR